MKRPHVLLLLSAAQMGCGGGAVGSSVAGAPIGCVRTPKRRVINCSHTRHPRLSCYIIAVKTLYFRAFGIGTAAPVTRILKSRKDGGGTVGGRQEGQWRDG